MSRAASIAKQAVEKNLVTKAEFGINPGSEQVRYTAERDGLLKTFEDLDAKIFTNACGPCIGQWAREGADKQEKNSIIHSFNRNFSKRADGNPTHISMAGPWLRYRGHLDNISNNCLIGAVNAYNQKTNFVKNQLTGEYAGVPETQRQYKEGIETVVVGDHNYGEGSSREHAAMEPRFLGVKVVLVKSFARIHETNLKKQGMLGITFDNESDYDLIREDDTFNFVDLKDFSAGKQITIEVVHADGSKDLIKANHSYNSQQIEWFKEGSALNLIKKQNAAA